MITVVSFNPAVDRIIPVTKLTPGMLHRELYTLTTPGGKGPNVARVAKQLGADVCITGLSGGRNGKWLYDQLKQLGIKVCTVDHNSETRVNTNIIDSSNPPEETELLEKGAEIDLSTVELLLNCYKESIIDSSLVVISGSLPAGAPTNLYKELIHIAKENRLSVLLDTSGEALNEALKDPPQIIKPNVRELSNLVGRQLKNYADKIVACKDIIRTGVKIVVLSMGIEGAMVVGPGYVLIADLPEIDGLKVRNTIGSGDAMVGGIAYVISESGYNFSEEKRKIDEEGYIMKEALKKGMACALSNTSFLEIGYISKDMVCHIEKNVIIHDY